MIFDLERESMRLNNYISSSGLCSRRKADELIKSGKVKVNSKIADLGYKLCEGDIVEVDGKLVEPNEDKVYIALYKPVGITCTTEEHIDGNIVDYVNYNERIFPVGRLDKDSEGLIFLTNDGDIVNRILREENHHEKEYIVTVDKPLDVKNLKQMSQGVRIFNPVKNVYVTTKPCKIHKISDKSFKIILSQGLNRQIRRMCRHFGYKVMKLKRVRILDITLDGLAYGRWRFLTKTEIADLKKHTSI